MSDYPPSVEPEGRAAHAAGVAFADCPHYRGEDRWAWQHGWLQAEDEARKGGLYDDSPGPGWDKVCRECLGITVAWPGARLCQCGSTKNG